jgi:hypothetical protein
VDQFEGSNPLNWRLHRLAPSRRGGRGVAGLAPLLAKEGQGAVVRETLPARHSGNFKKRTNDARMLLKTKERCGKLGLKAGMYLKTMGVIR